MKEADSAQELLVVRNLSYSRRGVAILSHIHLWVHRQRLTAVVGADGAGKTTLLKAIAGLLNGVTGEVIFAGEPIHRLPPWEIVARGLVYVPEGMRVFPQLTVLENLEIGAYCRREGLQAHLERVLEIFPELRERLEHPAGVLSGGQQRMVTLARGLMAAPLLLLLDEPFMGLSPKLVNRFCESFRNLARAGITLLISGQHIHRVLKQAQQAFVLEEGRITSQGRGPDLLNDQHLKEILFLY